jgi:hypothetical protein
MLLAWMPHQMFRGQHSLGLFLLRLVHRSYGA